ncbi:hypothetical protein [Flavisolibacter nicotianae]|uniref:hypothetical protein n=1 Tax=Flavisolibacter nicotianae TaxID=2364882 RepID=UPI000EB3357B|nr:hypothetical protein [Flavisolibacter nicotianae]
MKLLSLFLIALLPLLSFKSKPADEGYYAFIVVDGVWKDHTGYASRIIYFPGYTECNKYRDIDFFAEAKRSFSSHLKAYYTEAFPYGENNNFQMIDRKKFSTYDQLKSKAHAEQRLTEWIAEQKEKGYNVVTTNFGFSCENLK